MMRELAIADAYGAGFEFSSEQKVDAFNDLNRYCCHDLYGMSAKYTDDTQMSIAVSELVLCEVDWSNRVIADKFVECFKRDPRRGYSKRFYDLLVEVSDGQDLLNSISGISDRNGAAMRSVPLGFIRDKNELLYKARAQAAVTHKSDVAINASCAIALAAHFGLHERGKLSDLQGYLSDEGFLGWDFGWTGIVSVKAFDTVSAAFSCLVGHNDLSSLLKACVSLRGDVDSVSAIAVGLATCFESYEKELPACLVDGLDEPKFGLDFLGKLDAKLMALL